MRYNSAVILLLVGLFVLVGTSGCKSDEDKVRDVVQRAVDQCLEGKDTFVEITLFDRSKTSLLREGCEEPMGEVTMVNKIQAKVSTGPIEWMAEVGGAGSAWVLAKASWENVDRARLFRRESDATVDEYQRAEDALAAAQEQLPRNSWIRVERLKNLLDLRVKTLVAGDPEPTHIGDAARTYYKETLAWAEEANKPEVAAEARVMVIEHLRRYRNRQLSALDAIGSQDAWLEKSISEALKEGNKDEAEKMRVELEERQANAVNDRVVVQERIDQSLANICAEMEGLSLTGVADSDLRERISGVLESVQCGDQAKAAQ